MAQDIEGMTHYDLAERIDRGHRVVYYTYCFSILIMTFKRSSSLRLYGPDESRFRGGLPWVGLTMLLGWWGLPWGPIYSLQCIVTSLGGGHDATDEVVRSIHRQQRRA